MASYCYVVYGGYIRIPNRGIQRAHGFDLRPVQVPTMRNMPYVMAVAWKHLPEERRSRPLALRAFWEARGMYDGTDIHQTLVP